MTQYVVLGAGLDTFAYRNPFPALRVFEVDFPATQVWKRAMLEQVAIALPANLVFVALDFEHQTLADGLAEAGLDFQKPAFFGWLGCGAVSDARCISGYVERGGADACWKCGHIRLRGGAGDVEPHRTRCV